MGETNPDPQYDLRLVLFPVPGARPHGVHPSATVPDGSSAPTSRRPSSSSDTTRPPDPAPSRPMSSSGPDVQSREAGPGADLDQSTMPSHAMFPITGSRPTGISAYLSTQDGQRHGLGSSESTPGEQDAGQQNQNQANQQNQQQPNQQSQSQGHQSHLDYLPLDPPDFIMPLPIPGIMRGNSVKQPDPSTQSTTPDFLVPSSFPSTSTSTSTDTTAAQPEGMPLVDHFPMPGVRKTNGGPSIQADGNTYTLAALGGLSQADIERHQRSQNGPTADDPYIQRRLYPFPVPGQRPSTQGKAPPRVEGVSQMLKEYDDVYLHGPGSPSTGAMGPTGLKADTITRGWRMHRVEDVKTGESSVLPAVSNTHGRNQPPPEIPSTIADPIASFLRELPQPNEGPARQAMWTEMIRLKTRTLELQIAEHRRKEKEAELELARLQQQANMMSSATGSGGSGGTGAGSTQTQTPSLNPMGGAQHLHGLSPRSTAVNTQGGMLTTSNQGSATQGLPQPNHASPSSFSNYPLVTHARSPVIEGATFTDQLVPSIPPLPPHLGTHNTHTTHMTQAPTPGPVSAPTPMTPFDLEALLQENTNLDHLFSWLPELGDSMSDFGLAAAPPPTAAPADLVVPSSTSDPSLAMLNPFSNPQFGQTPDTGHPRTSFPRSSGPDSGTATASTSPQKRRSMSPDSPVSGHHSGGHVSKKAKRPAEKKVVIERNTTCSKCSQPIARLLFRAPRSQMPTPITVDLVCPDCSGVHQPSSIDTASMGVAVAAAGTAPGSGTTATNPAGRDPLVLGQQQVGSIETRKRMRTAMEDEDLMTKESTRRCFCDVCHRVVAVGQIIGGEERDSLGYMCEIVCTECDGKYQRCTDCGGGGGPRVGIGKWRLKQVFQPGRKTCSLSHSRLGDRPREIGVHVTPTDFTPEQMKEVLTRCKTLWYEKTLSRLAVPEMFEIDLAPNLINPLRNFQDIEDIIARQWPSRETMIKAEGVDPKQFKRLLGLTWAHSRPRRSVRSIDLEEEYARAVEANDDDDMSTVLANVKRTNVVIPAGSELVGMWGGEWDMIHGSLLVSTFIPFEGTDGEDVTALSVGELITKVQGLQQKINAERVVEAQKKGVEPDLLPQCEHLWVVSGGNMPLIKERMTDILIRKRAFVHVEEYLTRHPEFIHALNARPVGLHPDLNRPLPHQVTSNPEYTSPHPLVLVRWLGKDFDAAKILEIKQLEFGGGAKARAKLKKMPKSRV